MSDLFKCDLSHWHATRHDSGSWWAEPGRKPATNGENEVTQVLGNFRSEPPLDPCNDCVGLYCAWETLSGCLQFTQFAYDPHMFGNMHKKSDLTKKIKIELLSLQHEHNHSSLKNNGSLSCWTWRECQSDVFWNPQAAGWDPIRTETQIHVLLPAPVQ